MKLLMNIFVGISLALTVCAPSFAAEPAGHRDDDHMTTMNAQQQEDMFLEKKVIDGHTVSFHVMKAGPGMAHDGSHNFMVKIEMGDKVLDDVVVNSKVIAPDGHSESKFLQKMGDWYMNGYDLREKGRYQFIILFKTADGKKHKGGVYYERSRQ